MSNQFENVIKEFDKYSYYTEGKIARGIKEHEKWAFDLCKKYFPHSRLFRDNTGFDNCRRDFRAKEIVI